MPDFLDRQRLYRALQRELPEDVYPDGAPSGFYSTADMDSVADCAATGYANLERVYENYFPQDADERIDAWEVKAFGYNLPASLTLQERRDRVVAKLRARNGISKPDIVDVVKSIIGTDKTVEIREWGCADGGWMLDISQLDIETILNGQNLVDATGALLCEGPPSAYGKTDAEWAEMQEEAYTYDVLIYGYTLSAAERRTLDETLDAAEPARSTHHILDGLEPPDLINGDD